MKRGKINVIKGKIEIITIDEDGSEVTDWFTLEEVAGFIAMELLKRKGQEPEEKLYHCAICKTITLRKDDGMPQYCGKCDASMAQEPESKETPEEQAEREANEQGIYGFPFDPENPTKEPEHPDDCSCRMCFTTKRIDELERTEKDHEPEEEKPILSCTEYNYGTLATLKYQEPEKELIEKLEELREKHLQCSRRSKKIHNINYELGISDGMGMIISYLNKRLPQEQKPQEPEKKELDYHPDDCKCGMCVAIAKIKKKGLKKPKKPKPLPDARGKRNLFIGKPQEPEKCLKCGQIHPDRTPYQIMMDDEFLMLHKWIQEGKNCSCCGEDCTKAGIEGFNVCKLWEEGD